MQGLLYYRIAIADARSLAEFAYNMGYKLADVQALVHKMVAMLNGSDIMGSARAYVKLLSAAEDAGLLSLRNDVPSFLV